MKIRSALIWAIILCCGVACVEADIPVVKDGEAQAVILISPSASPRERYAAELLKEYIRKSTGAELPIETVRPTEGAIVSIGVADGKTASSLPSLDADGFVMESVSSQEYQILGGSDWGAEFGVYEFLERFLKVAWLMPTPLGEDVPPLAELSIPPGRVVQTPAFLDRQLSPYIADESQLARPRSSRMPGPHLKAGDEWARRNRLRRRVEFHHNLYELYKPSVFSERHPEFYPLVKGKRLIPTKDGHDHWQPNFAAPGIARAGADRIISYFEEHPDRSSYSLGVNDGYDFDTSPESLKRRKGGRNAFGYEDVSDDYFLWANEVAHLVKERFPDRRLGLLAYSSIANPPSFPLESGLVPFLTYERMRWADPVLKEMDQQNTRDWLAKATEVGWYDYAYGWNYLVPKLWPHQMKEYLQWGRANGVRYYYSEVYPNWNTGPKVWIQARLLWNPDLDVDQLLTEWCQRAVGEAAAPSLKAYYALWEKFWTHDIMQSNWDIPSARNHSIPVWNRRSGQYLPFETPTYLLSVPDDYLRISRQYMEETVAKTNTQLQRQRAEKLAAMWNLFEVSARLYKLDNLWRGPQPTSPEEALVWLERIKAGQQFVAERSALIDTLRNDELYGYSIVLITASPTVNGKRWSTGALWALLPWIGREQRIREGLEQWATETQQEAIREEISRVLRAADGGYVSILQNGTFEHDLAHWKTNLGKWLADDTSGKKGLISFTGRFRGELLQKAPAFPGKDYYLRASVRLKGESVGTPKVHFALATLDRSNRVRGGELPSLEVNLAPGDWNTVVIPFHLGRGLAHIGTIDLRLLVKVEGISQGATVLLDDLEVVVLDDKRKR